MSDDSLWADIVAIAKEYGIDLSKPNERKEKREPKPVWRPTGGIPYGLCGECGYWEAEKGRTKIEGKRLSVHLGRCEIDKLRHDRCQRECDDFFRRGGAPRERAGNNPNKPTKVQCIETGVVYDSARDAAQQTGITDFRAIRAAARGDKKTAGRCRWRYVYDDERDRRPGGAEDEAAAGEEGPDAGSGGGEDGHKQCDT